MAQDSESKKQNDTEARENSSPTTGKKTQRRIPLKTGPLPEDHPLLTTGFVVGVKPLNPSPKKPLDEPEIEEERSDRDRSK